MIKCMKPWGKRRKFFQCIMYSLTLFEKNGRSRTKGKGKEGILFNCPSQNPKPLWRQASGGRKTKGVSPTVGDDSLKWICVKHYKEGLISPWISQRSALQVSCYKTTKRLRESQGLTLTDRGNGRSRCIGASPSSGTGGQFLFARICDKEAIRKDQTNFEPPDPELIHPIQTFFLHGVHLFDIKSFAGMSFHGNLGIF